MKFKKIKWRKSGFGQSAYVGRVQIGRYTISPDINKGRYKAISLLPVDSSLYSDSKEEMKRIIEYAFYTFVVEIADH